MRLQCVLLHQLNLLTLTQVKGEVDPKNENAEL